MKSGFVTIIGRPNVGKSTLMNHLIGQKIDPSRLTTRGLAYDDPIADNSTEEGRAQNRRVEILITANDAMIQQAQQEAAAQ